MKAFFKPLRPASFFIFLSLVTGILWGNYFPDSGTLVFGFAISLFVIFCPAVFLNKKAGFLLFLGLVVCFGYHSIQVKLTPDLPPHHISNYLDQKKNLITGKVVSFAKHYEKKYKITLLCRELETKDHIKERVTGKISLSIYGLSPTGPKFGDIIVFDAAVHSVQNFMNPGAFDYERSLKEQGIYGTAYADAGKIKILTQMDQMDFFSRWIWKIENLRTRYYYFILSLTEHSNAGKITASLVTGKKEVISPDIRDLFSKAGISHLLAISGLHLSIIGCLFFYLFYRVLSLIPVLLISGRARKIAGVLTLVPLTVYAVFSGFSPSTQRALLMITVLLFSFVSEREKDILSSLSVAGILILLMDSAALFSISFQLSFVAVIFIICGASLLKRYPVLLNKHLFSKIISMVCVTFFAGLGTLPLTAHYFNMVSAVALISNIIFIPVIGFVVLPAGLVSLVCFSCFPLVAAFIIQGCSKLIGFSIIISEILVSVPGSWSRTTTWQWIEVAAIYLVFISVFLLLKGHRKSTAFMLVLAFLLVMVDFSNDRSKTTSNAKLTITIIDVGQGNSALIQTPAGQNILVDGGGFSDTSSFDTGRFIIAPFLWQKKIRALDYVILTHPDSDHLNGLVFILNNFDVKLFIKNTDEKNSKPYATLIKTCEQKNIRIWNPLSEGDPPSLGDIRLVFYDSVKDNFLYDLNNNSLVFKVIYKEFSMLFPGDISACREKNLSRNKNIDLHSDIILSPHHGSSKSSTKFLLDKVQPKSVIISCGRHNKYGFPHHTVSQRYSKMGIKIFQTDKDGAIFISSDGKNHNILTHKGG